MAMKVSTVEPGATPSNLLVAVVLTAHNTVRRERAHRFKQRCLLIALGLVVFAGGRIHGEIAEHLQHVILHHVAQRAGFVVELAAIADAKALGHGDLDAADVVAIPDRFENRVGKARVKDVLYRFFAEIVIDAIDVLFRKELMQSSIERLGGRKIVAKWLLDDDTGVGGAAGVGKALGDGSKQAGWNGKIMQRRLGIAKLLAQLGEGRRVAVVPIDVTKQADHLLEGCLLQPAMILQAVLGTRLQLIKIPTRLGDADDGNVESLIANQILQRWENLLVGKIACGSEEYESIRHSI